ncbi:MAG: hypothetical protein HC933_04650 [Pleurocapsa sp. SU_196_0]|nr:hypothetical protein [Pleurocapsa sp. SU_196_0]
MTWGSRKAAEFFFLLLERPNGVTTWEAAEALWPDKDESRAASVFHTTLHRLRKVLDDELVFTRNRRYYLNGDLVLHYDVREYMELTKRAQSSLDLETFERAISLYQGAYLADFESDWCQDLRETLHGTHLSLLLDASRRAEALGARVARRGSRIYPRSTIRTVIVPGVNSRGCTTAWAIVVAPNALGRVSRPGIETIGGLRHESFVV